MAQLRDSQTSALIAEGTPNELVTIAEAMGLKAGVVPAGETAEGLDAIYDDVGLSFDPDAAQKSRDERIDGLKKASTKTATPDDTQRESIKASHAAAVAEVEEAKGKTEAVQSRIDAARSLVE